MERKSEDFERVTYLTVVDTVGQNKEKTPLTIFYSLKKISKGKRKRSTTPGTCRLPNKYRCCVIIWWLSRRFTDIVSNERIVLDISKLLLIALRCLPRVYINAYVQFAWFYSVVPTSLKSFNVQILYTMNMSPDAPTRCLQNRRWRRGNFTPSLSRQNNSFSCYFCWKKVSQATALADRFPTVRLVIGEYRWLGELRAKLLLKASRVCVALSHAIGLEECEIISSFTQQSRTLVSTLFISLLLSHVTGNTFISSLTKCDFCHVLFLSATAFKSHTWSFKTFAQNNREYTISLISDGAIFNWALEVVRVWFDFCLFLYVIGLENLRH